MSAIHHCSTKDFQYKIDSSGVVGTVYVHNKPVTLCGKDPLDMAYKEKKINDVEIPPDIMVIWDEYEADDPTQTLCEVCAALRLWTAPVEDDDNGVTTKSELTFPEENSESNQGV